MLHNEARKLLVEGYEATHNAEAIAKIFHVNKYTVYHLEERKRKTGSVDLQTWRRGRKALLSSADKARIAERITKNSTISLGELRTQLGLKISISTMSRVVRALGFRVKKVGLSATERERPRCAGKTYQVERVKAPPHNSAARLAMPFPPSAACKFLDLPPVNLRNLHLHLTKNPFASRPPHLCGVTLNYFLMKMHHDARRVQSSFRLGSTAFSVCGGRHALILLENPVEGRNAAEARLPRNGRNRIIRPFQKLLAERQPLAGQEFVERYAQAVVEKALEVVTAVPALVRHVLRSQILCAVRHHIVANVNKEHLRLLLVADTAVQFCAVFLRVAAEQVNEHPAQFQPRDR